jgi:hypothetical protein
VVAPELIGCLLVKRQPSGELMWGVIVETESYSQEEPATRGYRRRSPSNETLFAEPGRFYVYVSCGIHHCVKGVISSANELLASRSEVSVACHNLFSILSHIYARWPVIGHTLRQLLYSSSLRP